MTNFDLFSASVFVCLFLYMSWALQFLSSVGDSKRMHLSGVLNLVKCRLKFVNRRPFVRCYLHLSLNLKLSHFVRFHL